MQVMIQEREIIFQLNTPLQDLSISSLDLQVDQLDTQFINEFRQNGWRINIYSIKCE